MNIKSSELLALTQQQLEAQQCLNRLSSQIKYLAASHNVDVIASLPKLDADLQKLARFNKAISVRLHVASH